MNIFPRFLLITTRSDGVLFRFLENYLNQLEGPLAVQVWHRFLQLAKDVISNIRDFRAQVFPALRFAARHLSLPIIL
jgi:hypothetical protein